MEKQKAKKVLPEEIAWKKIMDWCAYQERSQQEARDKLYTYGLYKNQVELMISKLVTEGFINEERFAITYAGGKFRILGWGKEKIKLALKQKKVSDYCIRKAMVQINENDYRKKLELIFRKRQKEIKEKNIFKRNYKLAQYAISRGFESEIVWDLLREKE